MWPAVTHSFWVQAVTYSGMRAALSRIPQSGLQMSRWNPALEALLNLSRAWSTGIGSRRFITHRRKLGNSLHISNLARPSLRRAFSQEHKDVFSASLPEMHWGRWLSFKVLIGFVRSTPTVPGSSKMA